MEKTVLLNRIETIAEREKAHALLIEAPEGGRLADLLFPHLKKVLLRLSRGKRGRVQARRGLGVSASFARVARVSIADFEFGVDPEIGHVDSGDIELDLSDVFTAIGHAAQEAGTAVVVMIDEVQHLSKRDLGALIVALHRIAQRGLPLVFFGAGLPQLAGLAGQLAGQTKPYAERLFDYPDVGALGTSDAREALRLPAVCEEVTHAEAALDAIVKQTTGYPYFLQEWGKHAWNVADSSPLTLQYAEEATRRALQRLDAGFFRVRLDRLTPEQKEYMHAMASLGEGPHRSGDIADRLSVTVQRVAPMRGKLIGKVMIYSPAHGDAASTVPMFDVFMLRTARNAEPGKNTQND